MLKVRIRKGSLSVARRQSAKSSERRCSLASGRKAVGRASKQRAEGIQCSMERSSRVYGVVEEVKRGALWKTAEVRSGIRSGQHNVQGTVNAERRLAIQRLSLAEEGEMGGERRREVVVGLLLRRRIGDAGRREGGEVVVQPSPACPLPTAQQSSSRNFIGAA